VRLGAALALSLLAPARFLASTEPTVPGQTRALWVTRNTLTSPAAIAQMVGEAGRAGFNTLLVQVRGRGDAYYTSTLEPRAAELLSQPGFDPLATTLELAHAGGLKVHAWVSVNLVASARGLPNSREHVVYRAPDWLMVPRELAAEMRALDPRSPSYIGRLARWTRAHSETVEGLYTSPIHPGAAAHATAVIDELVRGYAVDGVHLDYARYPDETFDYSAPAVAAFKAEIRPALTPAELREADARETIDPLAYPDLFPDRWTSFRRSRLTTLVMRIRSAVRAVRPDAIVSAAVVPDFQQAFASRLQDWRMWMDEGLLDVLCPMAYTTEPALFARQVSAAVDLAAGRAVWAGIGAYRLSPADTLERITAARRLGVAGVILFSYDALVTPPNTSGTLTELGRAAFGAGPE
jgi:uncharacterized lipoprotein YddW (UPF0748 family)